MRPDHDQTLGQTLFALLGAPPRNRYMNFDFGRISIRSKDYEEVGRALSNGRIIAIRNSDVGPLYAGCRLAANGIALYSQVLDTMTMADGFSAARQAHVAAVFHEATHAILDMRNSGSSAVGMDEAAAYFADALYLISNGQSARSGTNPDENAVFGTAEALVKQATAGFPFTALQRGPGPLFRVSANDAAKLAMACAAHPNYAAKGESYVSDGIPD